MNQEEHSSTGAGAWRGRWLLAALIAALAAGGAYALHKPAPAPAARAAIPVHLGVAERRDMPVWLSSVGTVTALNVVDIKTRIDGQLQKIAFAEGQEVAPGALLAQIDPRPLRAALQQAQATLQKDAASVASLRLDAQRYAKLAEIGAGSTQSRDTSQAQLAAQLGAVAADQAQVETARLQLDYATIRAPFGGRLGMRQADVGAMVKAADAAGLVTLTQIAPITVLFSLPQENLGELVQQQARAPLAVAVADASGGKPLADGRLAFIDSQVDAATGQIKLKAGFANADRALWPGQLVTARLLLRTDHGVVALPSRAIMTGQDGNFVYVTGPDHKASVRKVATGASDGAYTTVTAGLQGGEQVVLDGQSRLAQGTPVTAMATAAAAQGAR